MRQDRNDPSGWHPFDAAAPPAMESAPVSSRQPAAGVIWGPTEWASYGHPNWPQGRCFVCGGSIALHGAVGGHSSCIASLDAYSDGLRAIGASVVFPPRPSPDQYRLPGADPGKSGNSSISADSADSVELAEKLRAFEATLEAASADTRLIDAVAMYGVVIRTVDVGSDRRFSAEANGKVVASDHFPTWRAAATAGIARARSDALPPGSVR